MNKLTNKRLIEFFALYNRFVQEAKMRAIEEATRFDRTYEKALETDLYERIWGGIQARFSSVTACAETIAWIQAINQLDAIKDLARHAGAFCQDNWPNLVKDKLTAYRPMIVEWLYEMIIQADWEKRQMPLVPDDEIDYFELEQRMAVSFLILLTDWREERVFDRLLVHFMAVRCPAPDLAEAMLMYVAVLADQCLPDLPERTLQALKTGKSGSPGEYLLGSLTQLARSRPSDAYFALLCKAFTTMHDKRVGARCLIAYDDERAADFLCDWLKQKGSHQDSMIRQAIFDTVWRLGGPANQVFGTDE